MHDLRTYRIARATLAAGLLVLFTGCGGGSKTPIDRARVIEDVKRVVKKLPWDKVISVTVNRLTGVAVFNGVKDGNKVEAEFKLTAQELEKLQNEEGIEIEMRDGRTMTVKPAVEKAP